ncbi:hypothetical protein GCM10010976_34320 [Bizionia arctica]|uniref:Uncharacterized protein n=2 Tax=Bizionia arctica TaxID=1495645 RepID=A0A917GYN7_9FLAO|nr:hypothetical protein GCM10010976_34320 [Bizionia arctica]
MELDNLRKRMNQNLKQIFELETAEKYNEAYSEYQKLISENNAEFETWKHYFFFLWSMIEDVNGLFKKDIDLRSELEIKGQEMLKKAFEMEQSNPIYKMVYLGSKSQNDKEQSLYKNACAESKLILKTKHSGKGLLNEYYNQVFNLE